MDHDIFTGVDPVTGHEFLLTVWFDPRTCRVIERTIAVRSDGGSWGPPVVLTQVQPPVRPFKIELTQ